MRHEIFKNFPIKAVLAFSTALCLVAPMTASAHIQAAGTASLFLDRAQLATLNIGGSTQSGSDADGNRHLYVNDFFVDHEFSYSALAPGECGTDVVPNALCNNSPRNTPGVIDSSHLSLPVVPGAVSPYQSGNIATNWTDDAGGSIGLAGALKIKSDFQNPDLSIRWGELSLVNSGTAWTLVDNLNGGSVFELVNVQQGAFDPDGDGHGFLTLSADLKFGNSDWGNFLSVVDTERLMGSIQVAPVPVPAAVWLFGSALLGLAGAKKRTASA